MKSLTVLRIAVAALLFVHGAVRALLGGVAPFGGWLDDIGFPAGIVFAWAVTLLELVGTPLLAAGKFVVPIAGYFIFQLTLGIAMVHAKEGWFVVGLGRNGVEYSVLLITCLVVLILGEREARAARHA